MAANQYSGVGGKDRDPGRFSVRYSQTAYEGLAMSLQEEWQYLLWTVPGVGEYMVPVEEALANKFLPKLLGLQSISGRLRKLLYLGAKRAGIGIPNPTEAADESHKTLQACCSRLVEFLLTGEALATAEHRAWVQRGSRNGRERNKMREEAHLARDMVNENNRGKLRLGRGKVAGSWLMVVPYLLNGATLLADEFRDNLIIRFGLVPLALRLTCNRCREKLSLDNSLQCKKGGLFTARHNNVPDEWGDPCAATFTPSAVAHKPLINYGGRQMVTGRAMAKVDEEELEKQE